MATIIVFDQNTGDTTELVQSPIANVERDDGPEDNIPGGCLTAYFETKEGKSWYITFNNEELALLKKVE